MKIKTKTLSLEEVRALPKEKHRHPKKPNIFFRTLLRLVSLPDLIKTGFTAEREGLSRLRKNEPCLFLMNHSSFIDLKIASVLLYPRPFNIVCTSDGFVGKDRLMRSLGCIPTKKFISDSVLVRDMLYAARTLKDSILMYPEASYSFDGTATPLPAGIGKCIKLLKLPVVMITAEGAFARDPLYNGLQLRRVKVSAKTEYLLSPEDIGKMTAEAISEVINEKFKFDNFRWQKEHNIAINEPFRGDGLHRVLYKCPHCGAEGETEGKGVSLVCGRCGATYILEEDGTLRSENAEPIFTHIPDWYAWERSEVRREIDEGRYRLQEEVDICMMVDTKWIYRVGEGTLRHGAEGFSLVGCDGKLDVFVPVGAMYSLYADYFWYEIGDMICIGDGDTLYYCFPKNKKFPVAKARLATEELYKKSRE